MEKYSENNIRNVILVSHSAAGKTSLADALYYAQGKATRLGSVDNGTSVSDYDPIEIERKISINISLLNIISGNTKINIIDTPGYADFICELINAVPAADAALVVISAPDGVQVGTQKAWDLLDKANLPRAIFISKLDKENTDFNKVLDDIQKNFGNKCLPIFLPTGNSANFKGVINILNKADWAKFPADLQERAQKSLEKFIELAAEADDKLVEKYLNGEELTPEEIKTAIKLSLSENKLVPVFVGNSHSSVGIKEMVSFISEYFPSPVNRAQVKAQDMKTNQEKDIKPSSAEPFSAYVFKTISDPYVGQLSIFRVFSGHLTSNTEFYNVTQSSSERFGQLYVLQGKEQLPVEGVLAGDIVAVAKLKNTHTNDSLSDVKNQVKFNYKVNFEPTMSYSLKPKTRQDEEKISQALAKIVVEDQGIKVLRDAQTKELIISGMGDSHLEINIERLKKRYNVDVEVGTPKVPYKETLKKKTRIQGKYKRQSGGRGQYGDVWLELEPLPRGQEFEFVDKVVGGAVPRNYIPSVEKGVRQAMSEGVIAGYPLVDVRVTIYDGSYHEVDSSDMAFQIAGGMALRKGAVEANPVLLEPIMDMEVVIPDDYMGAVTGDLNSRRGRVQGMEPAGKYQMIKTQVPLAEVLRYGTDLRSMTQGRGSYSMKFSHFEEVPQRIAEKIIANAKIEHKEE